MKKYFLCMLIGLSLSWSCNHTSEDMTALSTLPKETKSIVYDYPDKNEMLTNSEVIRYMNQAWKLTKDMAAINERRELGFYIYSNKPFYSGTTGYDIIVGKLQYGPIVNDANQVPFLHYDRPTNDYYCGFFHTHTPLTYVQFDYSRTVGPSSADQAMAWDYGFYCPGFVYDYEFTIFTGHYIDAPAKIYHFGPIVRI